MQGNLVNFAVDVVVRLAFGAIVNSLVNDLIMPIIGAITERDEKVSTPVRAL